MSEYSPLFVCASFSPIAGLPQQNSARVHRLRPVTPFAMRESVQRQLARRGFKKVEPVFDELTKISYHIHESSSPGNPGGWRGQRLLLHLKHDVQGNMFFQVYDSNDGLVLGHCSRDHLAGVMVSWDEALLCLDGDSLKSQLESAKRYPEVYVLMCVDLFSTQFAQTAVGQQYMTSQQRADLLCPFSEDLLMQQRIDTELLHRPLGSFGRHFFDKDDHSRKIIRFTDDLIETVKSRAVSSINAAPISTSVQGPLSKIVRARTPSTAPPAVPTVAQFTADMGEVELAQVMANWMRFETLNEFPQYGELYDLVYFFDQGQVWT